MVTTHIEEAPAIGGGIPRSRQVSWFETYAYAARYASGRHVSLDGLPVAGTPQWCGMADDDARKLLALILGGVREALSHDTRQELLAEASREISAAGHWSTFAQQVRNGRGSAYIRRSA